MLSACAAFLLLAALAAAMEPKMTGAARLNVTIGWSIEVPQGLQQLAFSTYLFQNASYQTVESISSALPFSEKTDSFGNRRAEFVFERPAGSISIGMSAVVHVDYQAQSTLPAPYPVAYAADISRFVQPSQLVEIDGDIHTKALQIANGSHDALEIIARLAEWVHNGVEYDSAYESTSQGAKWVYLNRRGTCDEYAHLLLALLRSLNIPARFVAGFVYSGEKWNAHAWVEAYTGSGWVSVDPTYNEMLVLDATHVAFAAGLDQKDITEEINFRGSAGSEAKFGNKAFNVSVLGYDGFAQPPAMRIEARNGSAGPSSIETLNVTISNPSSLIRFFPVALNVPREMTVVDYAERLVYLLPGGSGRVSFRVLFPADMKKNYVYKFPAEVATLGAKQGAMLQGDADAAQQGSGGIIIKDITSQLQPGGLSVRITIRNAGSSTSGELAFALENYTQTRAFSLAAGEAKQFEFFAAARGAYALGNVSVSAGASSAFQPFYIDLSAAKPVPSSGEAPQPDGGSYAAIIAALAVLALALVLSRKKKEYKEL